MWKRVWKFKGLCKFYINYVVCKLAIAAVSPPFANRFILTMWYVNDLSNLFGGPLTFCFILTMWYVNDEISLSVFSATSKFYIKYVVCKYIWT